MNLTVQPARRTYQFGDKINNGAMVIEFDPDTRLALCRWHGVQPWVVWTLDNNGNAECGHYFSDLHPAVEKYNVKVAAFKSY